MMSKEKRRVQKEQARKARVKRKLLKKRTLLREERKLEKELEQLKKASEPKLAPFRKDQLNETES